MLLVARARCNTANGRKSQPSLNRRYPGPRSRVAVRISFLVPNEADGGAGAEAREGCCQGHPKGWAKISFGYAERRVVVGHRVYVHIQNNVHSHRNQR